MEVVGDQARYALELLEKLERLPIKGYSERKHSIEILKQHLLTLKDDERPGDITVVFHCGDPFLGISVIGAHFHRMIERNSDRDFTLKHSVDEYWDFFEGVLKSFVEGDPTREKFKYLSWDCNCPLAC